MIDISKITEYLYVGSRVGKEHADKLLVGVAAAAPVIQNKGKVLVFCMEGKRRSVAMAAAILISMGHTSKEAIDLLTTARKVADPRRWDIRRQIIAFEKYWGRNKSNE